MSFGFSAGDFVTAVEISWKVYRAIKDAPAKFGLLEAEVSSLNIVLRTLHDDAENPDSLLNRRGSDRRDHLMGLVRTVEIQMTELRHLVQRYQSLSTGKKQLFDRLMFAPKDLEKKRTALANQVLYINAFQTSLSQDSLSRIERILEDGVKGIREGRRAPSIVSVHRKNDKPSWIALEDDLAKEGIPKSEIEKHKKAIKDYIQLLIAKDTIPEEASDEENSNWDSISVRMGNVAVSDDSEYESAESEMRSNDVEPTEAVSAVQRNADMPANRGPSAARVEQWGSKKSSSSPVLKSVTEWSIRVRCPDETTEIVNFPDPSHSERTVKDLQQVLEIRKGYPAHSSKLSFEEIPGGLLTELRSKALLKDTAIRTGDTIYCTTDIAVKTNENAKTAQESAPSLPSMNRNQPMKKKVEVASPAIATQKSARPQTSWTFSVKFPDNTTVQFRVGFGIDSMFRPASKIIDLKQQIEKVKGYKCQLQELSFSTTPTAYLKNERSLWEVGVDHESILQCHVSDKVESHASGIPKTFPATEPFLDSKLTPEGFETATALFDFTGGLSTDLAFKAGDTVKILHRTNNDNEWWTGWLAGRTGQIPGNYLRLNTATQPMVPTTLSVRTLLTKTTCLFKVKCPGGDLLSFPTLEGTSFTFGHVKLRIEQLKGLPLESQKLWTNYVVPNKAIELDNDMSWNDASRLGKVSLLCPTLLCTISASAVAVAQSSAQKLEAGFPFDEYSENEDWRVFILMSGSRRMEWKIPATHRNKAIKIESVKLKIKDSLGVDTEDQHLFLRDSITGAIDDTKELKTYTSIAQTSIVNGSLLRCFLGKAITLEIRNTRSDLDFQVLHIKFFDLETVSDLKVFLSRRISDPRVSTESMTLGLGNNKKILRELGVISNTVLNMEFEINH